MEAIAARFSAMDSGLFGPMQFMNTGRLMCKVTDLPVHYATNPPPRHSQLLECSDQELNGAMDSLKNHGLDPIGLMFTPENLAERDSKTAAFWKEACHWFGVECNSSVVDDWMITTAAITESVPIGGGLNGMLNVGAGVSSIRDMSVVYVQDRATYDEVVQKAKAAAVKDISHPEQFEQLVTKVKSEVKAEKNSSVDISEPNQLQKLASVKKE